MVANTLRSKPGDRVWTAGDFFPALNALVREQTDEEMFAAFSAFAGHIEPKN